MIVHFDQPQTAKATAHCKVYVRSDLVCHPNRIDFRTVETGTAVTKGLEIHYAGRADWKLDSASCANQAIRPSLHETRRWKENPTDESTRVTYELTATLDEDAPIGVINDEIVVTLDDGRMKEFRVPVEGTVATPEEARLRAAFDLIDRSTDLMGWNEPDPVALVRAVNHLHDLGKEQAIATLRAYVKYAPQHGKPFTRDAPDQQKLCWIIPLLFAPIDSRAALPSLSRDPERTSKEWESFYISLEGDIPFRNTRFSARFGTPDPERGYLVEWAAEEGDLFGEPLRPVNGPLKACDTLFEKLLLKEQRKDGKRPTEGYRDNLKNHLRLQACRSLEHLFPNARRRFPNWGNSMSDAEWQRLKEAAAAMKIRWSESEQSYVAE